MNLANKNGVRGGCNETPFACTAGWRGNSTIQESPIGWVNSRLQTDYPSLQRSNYSLFEWTHSGQNRLFWWLGKTNACRDDFFAWTPRIEEGGRLPAALDHHDEGVHTHQQQVSSAADSKAVAGDGNLTIWWPDFVTSRNEPSPLHRI